MAENPPQSDLIDNPDTAATAGNIPVFSVSEISQSIKRTVEDTFSYVRVRGEVSRLMVANSGHMYLNLKDADAVLSGVCWRGTASKLAIRPEDGMEVIVTGRVSTYPGRSNYQIIIEAMELAGEGALLKLLEERRKKLLAEGLFDADRKRDIPYLPDVIGVVTSPTGAVIRDIMHRINDRFPRRVLLWPTRVQGESAAAEIAAAIAGFNNLASDGRVPRPDLIIVARGGGSLEDLWSFNEEIVVRAAAASEIPLISAVGHETDTTLIDYASDQRAPTPTAAAEMAVPVRSELVATTADLGARATRAAGRYIQHQQTALAGMARGLPEPNRIYEDATQRLDDRAERLVQSVRTMQEGLIAEVAQYAGYLRPRPIVERIAAGRQQLEERVRRADAAVCRTHLDGTQTLGHAADLLRSYSYERVLERGFVLATNDDGQPVTSVADADPGTELDLKFHDGVARTKVVGKSEKPKSSPPRTPQSKPQSKPKAKDTPKKEDPQGVLL